jgi:hypothetical protein
MYHMSHSDVHKDRAKICGSGGWGGGGGAPPPPPPPPPRPPSTVFSRTPFITTSIGVRTAQGLAEVDWSLYNPHWEMLPMSSVR